MNLDVNQNVTLRFGYVSEVQFYQFQTVKAHFTPVHSHGIRNGGGSRVYWHIQKNSAFALKYGPGFTIFS